ncbi:MAG TPA: alpha/beta hydrolase domain-containing protein, partial [Vicinamibacterales bacterium]|nr:alpha/beta hydrolase domain-containing protein [Vicinamibacterales bacterium]
MKPSVMSALAVVLVAGVAYAQHPNVVAVPGQPTLILSSFDLALLGYTTEEFFISGTASSYTLAEPPSPLGVWNAESAATAPFTTRIVVVRPTDPKKFNGTVVVEWLNVSGGVDAGVDWNTTHREITRNGYAYVAVSAQKVGIDGGFSITGSSTPLKKANPERYGRLVH